MYIYLPELWPRPLCGSRTARTFGGYAISATNATRGMRQN